MSAPRHVILFPLPFQGHITPMLNLASLLHSQGISITVFHPHLNFPDTTLHPNYHFISIPDNLDSTSSTAPGDIMSRVMQLNENCVGPFKGKVMGMRDRVMVVDALMYKVSEAAREMGMRTVVLRTGSAACCNVFFRVPELLEKGYLPVRECQMEVPVIELPPLRVKDLPRLSSSISNQSSSISNQGALSSILNQVSLGIRASTGLILNTFDALEGTEVEKIKQLTFLPVFPVGPLHKITLHDSTSMLKQDTSCIEWLDKQAPNSVLYVSFGSLACMDEKELVEAAWGLCESRVPFLWVIRPDSVRGSEIPELPLGFEEATKERGKVIKWAPQLEVLAHSSVGGFWTHNGWNSTMESISEGVPMLCRPSFGDQMMNARYVCEVWKIGITLENDLERGEICQAVRRLMIDEAEDMRVRAENLKQSASSCLLKGGSSSKAFENLIGHLFSYEH